MSPTYRDANGHFCSKEQAIEDGTYEEPEEEGLLPEEEGGEPDETYEPEPRPEFGETQRTAETVMVDTGRGDAVPVPVGSPFVATLERLAGEANYGGYFRIFLNGEEVVEPTDSPEKIESGMRVSITSYDKVA